MLLFGAAIILSSVAGSRASEEARKYLLPAQFSIQLNIPGVSLSPGVKKAPKKTTTRKKTTKRKTTRKKKTSRAAARVTPNETKPSDLWADSDVAPGLEQTSNAGFR